MVTCAHGGYLETSPVCVGCGLHVGTSCRIIKGEHYCMVCLVLPPVVPGSGRLDTATATAATPESTESTDAEISNAIMAHYGFGYF